MLKAIRKKHKEILWLLVFIIVPGFTLWGVSNVVIGRRGRGPAYAGVIFGRRVSLDELGESYTTVQNQAIMTYGYEQARQIERYLGFEQASWQRLIVLHEARKKGIKVTDKEVIEYIASMPLFQTQGKFDSELYRARLKLLFSNTPAKVFEQQIRESMLISKLSELVTGNIKVSEEDIRQAYKRDNEKVKIEYVLFPTEKYREKPTVDEGQIQKFYDENRHNYKKPDQVNVDYICLLYDSFLTQARGLITEEELQEFYQDNKERFRLSEPPIPEEKQEKEKSSVDERKQQEQTQPQYQTFEEVREQILDMLSHQEASNLAKEKIENIHDDLIEIASLEKVAQKYSLEIKQTGFFSQEDSIPEVGFSREFVEEAFQRQLGEYSDPIRTAKGFYVIQPRQKKQTYIPQLSEIAQQVKDDLIEEKALSLAQQATEETRKNIIEITQAEGMDFRKAADKLSLEVKESEFVSRNDYIPEVGPCQDIEEIFKAGLNQIGPAARLIKGYLLFRVSELQPIDETKFAEEKDVLREQLLNQKKQQTYSDWLKELTLRADLHSNLDQLRSSQRQ